MNKKKKEVNAGWAWRPGLGEESIKPKRKKRSSRQQKKRDKLESLGSEFYQTDEWRRLRYRVLEKYGGRCMACGRTAKDGVVIHVDHIRPRSKYPHLQLTYDNLQVLCEDCNLGKGNKSEKDWR